MIRVVKNKRAILILITLISFISVLLFSFSSEIFQYGDNCGYMTLGIAFAKGQGFSDPALPGNYHFLWWPPGFPIFIALFYLVFGAQWIFLKIIILLLLYSSFYLFASMIYKNEENLIKASLILSPLCVSSGIHLLSSYLYSEVFFTACSLIFICVWYKWRKQLSVSKIIFLSLFAFYLAAVRLMGLSFLLTLIFILPFSRDSKLPQKWYFTVPLLFLVFYCIFFLFVPPLRVDSFRLAVGLHPTFHSTLTGSLMGEQVSLTSLFSYYMSTVVKAIRGYGASLIPQSLIRSIYDLWDMNKLKLIVMGFVTCLVMIGWFGRFTRNKFLNMYVLFTMLVLFLHGPCYVRLLVPLIPFLFYFLFCGLEMVLSWLIKRNAINKSLLYSIWVVVIFDNGARTFTDPRRTMPAKFGDEQYQACMEWIARNAKPKEVVVCQNHSYLYLQRGEYSIPYNYAETANEFITYLDEHQVRFIVVSPFYHRAHDTYMHSTYRAAELYPKVFKRVFESADSRSYVLEYRPD